MLDQPTIFDFPTNKYSLQKGTRRFTNCFIFPENIFAVSVDGYFLYLKHQKAIRN